MKIYDVVVEMSQLWGYNIMVVVEIYYTHTHIMDIDNCTISAFFILLSVDSPKWQF